MEVSWPASGFFCLSPSPRLLPTPNSSSPSSCMKLMRHMGSCSPLPGPFTIAESVESPYTRNTIPFPAFVSCSKLQFTLQNPDQVSTPLCSLLYLPGPLRQTFVPFFFFLSSLPLPHCSSSPLLHLPKSSVFEQFLCTRHWC